ncbi:MAG TPA: hypothetical protein PL045_05565, partial [Chitinophagaceae bacterium]|nr:hypothetical protein [Chitinophagaceae bacterium]
MKKVFLIAILFSLTCSVFAQGNKKKKTKTVKAPPKKDTVLPSRTVVVTAAFEPSLKTTGKINFSAAAPSPDTARPRLAYNVPAQNLFFSYQSPALKALAANIDSALHWENKSYLKAGYGNFTTPYLQAALSFGDGVRSVVNVNGRYTSSKSSVPFQQFSKADLEAIGIFTTPDNKNEWSGKIFYNNNTQYQYGFQPDTLKFTKDDLRNRFTTF